MSADPHPPRSPHGAFGWYTRRLAAAMEPAFAEWARQHWSHDPVPGERPPADCVTPEHVRARLRRIIDEMAREGSVGAMDEPAVAERDVRLSLADRRLDVDVAAIADRLARAWCRSGG